MAEYEAQLKSTIETATRKQDSLNPRKYRYARAFDGLVEGNRYLVVIVLFGFGEDHERRPVANNYVVTAYQKGNT